MDYGATVISKEGELLVQSVTCKPKNFDSVWDEYVNALLASGGQKIIDEQREVYQEGTYRGGIVR